MKNNHVAYVITRAMKLSVNLFQMRSNYLKRSAEAILCAAIMYFDKATIGHEEMQRDDTIVH